MNEIPKNLLCEISFNKEFYFRYDCLVCQFSCLGDSNLKWQGFRGFDYAPIGSYRLTETVDEFPFFAFVWECPKCHTIQWMHCGYNTIQKAIDLGIKINEND